MVLLHDLKLAIVWRFASLWYLQTHLDQSSVYGPPGETGKSSIAAFLPPSKTDAVLWGEHQALDDSWLNAL